MNEYETPCLCYARDAHQLEPERYAWCGNVLWAQWPECPTHHERLTSPVWTARLGQLKYEETAPAYEAEAVALEANV